MAPRRRISYVIPAPTEPVPLLQLPAGDTPRNGSSGPLLFHAEHSQHTNGDHARASNPRHRLGVASLALDVATQLVGRNAPEGILYSGGRDGLVMSWDLGIPIRPRTQTYGVEGARQFGGRWEAMTGWDDALDEEDEESDVMDGDVLGEVSGPKKRRMSHADDSIPFEQQWEVDLTSQESIKPTTYRQGVQMHSDWVNDVVLVNYNQTVISASSDGTVKAWSPHAVVPTEPSVIGSHADYVRCLAPCREQSWVASGSFDRTIKLWDLNRDSGSADTSPLITLNPPETSGPKASVYAIAADPFGHAIASGSPERVVRIWDPRSGKRTAKLVGHTDNIRSILISDDSRNLLTASSDGSIKLWSLTSQRCLHTFTHHTESVWSLFSSHPSFEVFYSGDRSGLVCRTDVERCADVSEGECIVLCQDKGEQNLATSEGVSKIISFDDSFVWTATGSSSIKRWRAPQRRSVRVPGSYGVQDGARSPHSPSNPRTSVSPSIVGSFRSGASLHRRDRDIDTGDSLNGIPYASLVHLTSLNDPFAPFSTTARGGDADVATLYSAASIMSVPRQARSPSQPAFSPGVDSPGLGPVNTARAEFEEREVATEASPLLDEPDAVITGDTGLVRSIILNDRIHALTIDAHGDVAVWDIVRGVALGRYSRGDIAAASQKGSVSGKSGGSERERSPREALETVRELVEGEAFVLQWCSVDTKTGMLTVNLNDKCLESELYADEAGYERGSFNDEQRINIGKWVLRNLFTGFVQEEQRIHSKLQESISNASQTKGVQRGSAPTHIDFGNSAPLTRVRTTSGAGRNIPMTPSSTVLASPALVPAVAPPIPAAARSSPLVTPMIQLSSTSKDANGLSPIPQSPTTGSEDPSTPLPPRKRSATVDETNPVGPRLFGRDNDYFSVKRSPAALPTSPEEGGSPIKSPTQDATPQPIATTPGATLMGRLKSFGRSTNKRPQSEYGNSATTPGGLLAAVTPAEGLTTPGPNAAQAALQALLAGPLTPASPHDAPPLSIPDTTCILISEESTSGWRTTYRGAIASTGADAQILEQTMPFWLLEYLLANRAPQVPLIKLSFVLLPYPTKNQNEALPELVNAQQSKLTASRFLRVRKLTTHVQEKLERHPGTPARTPRSSLDNRPGQVTSGKLRAEDEYQIICNDMVLPLDMTLAAIRQFVWRSSSELVMHYRRKPTNAA